MNGPCEPQAPQLCGCCEGIAPETPQPVANVPGLSAIAYRVGTQPTFLASMLAALSDPAFPALAGLRTRDESDFSIALLDAWACVCDILTFYQERLANESYLRTAVERRSVIELARLVGYQPSQGVSASTFVAFSLNTAPGAPSSVLIPAGSRVQSVPGPGQTAQTFETASDLTALVSQNAMPAQTTVPFGLNGSDTSMWVTGTANQLNVGDMLIFLGSGFKISDPLNPGQWDYHVITSVTTNPTSGNTYITWDSPLIDWFLPNDAGAQVYVFRKKAALFGVQAPDPRTLPSSVTGNVTGKPAAATDDWNYQYGGANGVNLDASYPEVTVPASGTGQWVQFVTPDWVYQPFQVSYVQDTSPLAYTLTTKTTQLALTDSPWLYPDGSSLYTMNQLMTMLVADTRNVTAYVQSAPLTPAGPPLLPWSYDGTYARASGVLTPVGGGSLAIVGGQGIAVGQPVGISGARLGLQVTTGAQAAFVPQGASAALAVSDGDTYAVDAFPPAPNSTVVTSGEIWQVISGSGIAGALHVAPANLALLGSGKTPPLAGEAAVVTSVTVDGPLTALGFDGPLTRLYDRATVTVNANTVAATDGQTTQEILGSGDGTNLALMFTLKQKPLTYTSAANGSGAQSTLEVWVNNLLWQEVDNFLASGPTARVYVTRADQTGTVTVQFGDGVQGARTPTGTMNIRATYRVGIGSAGNVAPGQLSQPIDRPQGLSSVTNPGPGTGGADPDTAAAARVSAPLHVLTLDRVVSLEDYQNFSQAFAGIAMALATWTWFGRTRGVFLTVAGADGATFQPGDDTLVKLKTALLAAGNPYVPITVVSYVPALFEVGANIVVDPDYDSTQVLAAAWQALVAAFAFGQRALGQGVAQSEIVALIQGVPGVVALEMTAFGPSGAPAPASGLPAVIQPAAPIFSGSGTPQAAQLLMLDPACQGGLQVWTT